MQQQLDHLVRPAQRHAQPQRARIDRTGVWGMMGHHACGALPAPSGWAMYPPEAAEAARLLAKPKARGQAPELRILMNP